MKKNGFTLVELLFCITVCSILLFFSLTSWTQFKQRNEVLRIISDIKSAIRYARTQSMTSSSSLRISSKNWSQGMVLTAQSYPDTLMHQWSWENANWDVQWVGVNGLNNIVFSSSITSAMSNGRFIITNKHNDNKIVLVMNRLGRIRQL